MLVCPWVRDGGGSRWDICIEQLTEQGLVKPVQELYVPQFSCSRSVQAYKRELFNQITSVLRDAKTL